MEKLVEVTRGSLVESVHRGSIAVSDADGKLLAWAGDPELVTYYRSAAKPIQALPVLTSGSADRFGLSEEELAIICASHSGEDEHVKVVTGLVEKLGLSLDSLLCGTHPPFHSGSAREIYRQGNQPAAVHCNCSGKHSGMLAICTHYGWSTENYLDLSHPLQKLLLQLIKDYHATDAVSVGVDGCGVPVYGMGLKEMAKGYARLVNPGPLPQEIAAAVRRIVPAMTANPRLIAGTGRLDTVIMEAVGSKVVSKCGAEGVQCLGLKEKGFGIAIKIEDGHVRATEPVAVEVLKQLGVLDQSELTDLGNKHRVPIKNLHKAVVGEIRPVFKLNFA